MGTAKEYSILPRPFLFTVSNWHGYGGMRWRGSTGENHNPASSHLHATIGKTTKKLGHYDPSVLPTHTLAFS